MSNEVPSPEIGSPPTPQPAERLRKLLAEPKVKNAEWQDEAGRMVSLLVVRFSQEPDDAEALMIVALVFLASTKGVKEAKKRVIRLVRWSVRPPPSLVLLGSLGEQRAAVTALAKVKAPWVRDYVDQALADTALPPALVPDLLKWARMAAAGWASFVGSSYATAVGQSAELARAKLLLREAPKLLNTTEPLPTLEAAEALGTLVRAIVAVASQDANNRKSSDALLQLGLGIVDQVWRAAPALLLQPALVSAYSQLSLALSAGKKTVPTSIHVACVATLALVIDSIPRFGTQAIEQWRPLVPIWSSAYPGFLKQLKAEAVKESGLAALLSDKDDAAVAGAENKRYAAEAAFAALLPAWDAFVTGLPDPTRAESLGNMLQRAAAAAGVEPFGAVGEEVNYDPLAHHLAGVSESALVRVKVVRSGALARRDDGSTRILVRALVNVA